LPPPLVLHFLDLGLQVFSWDVVGKRRRNSDIQNRLEYLIMELGGLGGVIGDLTTRMSYAW
jgi:hypothetical protein